MITSNSHELESDLSANEAQLLRELIRALRSIRYGSIALTVHEGKLVEIHKTERLRITGSEHRP
jgi:hypothetical protein